MLTVLQSCVIIPVECSADNNRTERCMTKADDNEHPKQSMKAVNSSLVLKNIFKVCFDLPSATNDDCEEHKKVRESKHNLLPELQLHCPHLHFPLHLRIMKNYGIKKFL